MQTYILLLSSLHLGSARLCAVGLCSVHRER